MTETDKPKEWAITFHRSWIPIRIGKRRETRSDHGLMAALMIVATVASITIGPMIAAPLFGFFAGVAFERWLSYPHLYGEEANA